jgi:hypothetical protein
MSYRIAEIDVHKKMLAVVVSDVEIESEYQFERRMFGSNPEQLRACVGIPRFACSCCWIFISGYTAKMPPTDYSPPSFYRVNYSCRM